MVFTDWGGALSGTQNPTTLRVSGNQTVIAHFATDSGGGGGGGTDPPPPSGALPTKGMVVGYFAPLPPRKADGESAQVKA